MEKRGRPKKNHEKVQLYMTPETHQRLRVLAMAQGKPMGEVVESLLAASLSPAVCDAIQTIRGETDDESG